MNERATTWGELLARRDERRFVGRRREIERFRLNYVYDVPQSLLFTINGPPGIGKSALAARYATIAREHGTAAAMLNRWDVELLQEPPVLRAMTTLADRLAAEGVPLTSFREVYREYVNALASIRDNPAAPGNPLGLLGGVEDDDPWAFEAWERFLVDTFPVRRASMLRAPIPTLTERFVQDLNAWATVRRILLIFDDWDALEADVGDWLLDLLLQRSLSSQVWVLLAGRAPLTAAWDSFAALTASSPLSPLDERATRLLLTTYDVGGEADAALLASAAQGNPLWLRILAGTADSHEPLVLEDHAEDVVEPDNLLEAYLATLAPAKRTKLLRASAARSFDEDVIASLMGVEAGQAFFAWLTNAPLTVQAGGFWRFHGALSDALRRLARRDETSAWRSAHGALLAYYRGRLTRWGESFVFNDPAWSHDKLEELYHSLMVEDEPDAVNAAMLSFVQGLRRSAPWARAVIRIWEQALSQALQREDVKAWGERTREIWAVIQDRDWASARSLLEQALTSPLWSDLVRESLRSLHQMIGARMALPPDEVAPEDERATPSASTISTEEVSLPEAPKEALDESASCELPQPTSESAEDEGRGVGGAVRQVADVTGEAQTADDTSSAEKAVQRCGYANARLRSGDFESALDAYDEAITMDPTYVAAYYNRGLTYVNLGALDLALEDFNQVLALDPDYVPAYRQRAQIHARRGHLERALADYDAALGRSPDDAVLYNDRANIYYRLNLYDRAIENYDEALRLDPDYIEAYLNRGLARVAQDDAVGALEDYNRALRRDAQRAVAYHYRGQAYAALERYSEALADYERAVNLNPRYAAANNSRGLIYVRLKAYPEALEAYQRAMAIRPEWATPFYNAACAAALMEDVERACGWLGRAISLREAYRAMALRDPDFAAVRDRPQFQALMETP
jgi:tetratricopeptide (TPR) repeat protein